MILIGLTRALVAVLWQNLPAYSEIILAFNPKRLAMKKKTKSRERENLITFNKFPKHTYMYTHIIIIVECVNLHTNQASTQVYPSD